MTRVEAIVAQTRLVPVLATLATLVMLASPEDADPLRLAVVAGGLAGGTVFDRDRSLPSGGRPGFSLGARVGFDVRLSRLGSAPGRFSILPAVELRHDFASPHTDWFGSISLGVTMTPWLRITTGLGYGLSSLDTPVPKHVLTILTGVGAKLGPVWLSVEAELAFRLSVTDGRGMRVLGAVTFEHELLSG